jgi:hypothetical protein
MPPAASIEFDDTLWPLLIIRISGKPTMRELEAYLDERFEYMRRPERHVEHDALIQQKVVATSVITSPLIRQRFGAGAGPAWRKGP